MLAVVKRNAEPFMSATLKPEDILTPEELAARLKVRKTWVYEQTRSRNPNPLPRLNVGRYLRFDWVKVIEWLTKEDSGDHPRKKRTGKWDYEPRFWHLGGDPFRATLRARLILTLVVGCFRIALSTDSRAAILCAIGDCV
jgi:hypothetical protein